MSGRSGRSRHASGRPFAGRSGHGDRDGRPGPPDEDHGLRPLLGARSVAGQVLLLQVLVAVLLISAAVVAVTFQTRRDSEQEAKSRSLAAAESFADAPGTAGALVSPDPAAVLQRHVDDARLGSGVDFMAVMAPDGTRLVDTDRTLIGKRAEGVERAAAGTAFAEIFEGAPNDAARAVVPVHDPGGDLVGLVAAGVAIENVGEAVDRHLPILLGSGAAALALAVGSSALVSRRLRRQTHGLGPTEMTRMYEHHNAVLHAVREGVLLVGGDGRLTLANDEARRLLELPADAEGGTSPSWAWTRTSPNCWPPAAPSPTRSTWRPTGCSPSTRGTPPRTAGPPVRSPRSGTPPSCGPCRARPRWRASG